MFRMSPLDTRGLPLSAPKFLLGSTFAYTLENIWTRSILMVAQCFLLNPFVFFLELDHYKGHVRCSCLVPQLQGAFTGVCASFSWFVDCKLHFESWMLTGPASSYLCVVTDFFQWHWIVSAGPLSLLPFNFCIFEKNSSVDVLCNSYYYTQFINNQKKLPEVGSMTVTLPVVTFYVVEKFVGSIPWTCSHNTLKGCHEPSFLAEVDKNWSCVGLGRPEHAWSAAKLWPFSLHFWHQFFTHSRKYHVFSVSYQYIHAHNWICHCFT